MRWKVGCRQANCMPPRGGKECCGLVSDGGHIEAEKMVQGGLHGGLKGFVSQKNGLALFEDQTGLL